MPNTSGVITYRPKAANRLGASLSLGFSTRFSIPFKFYSFNKLLKS